MQSQHAHLNNSLALQRCVAQDAPSEIFGKLPTWVTPLRSMRKRLMLQLPLLMELSMPWLMISARRFLPASKADALLAFDRVVSACASGSIHAQDSINPPRLWQADVPLTTSTEASQSLQDLPDGDSRVRNIV